MKHLVAFLAAIGILAACTKEHGTVITPENDCQYVAKKFMSPDKAFSVKQGLIPLHAENSWVYKHATFDAGGVLISEVADTVRPVLVTHRGEYLWWTMSSVFDDICVTENAVKVLLGGQISGCPATCTKYSLLPLGDTVDRIGCNHTDVAHRLVYYRREEPVYCHGMGYEMCMEYVDYYDDNETIRSIETVAENIGLVTRQLFDESGHLAEELTLFHRHVVNN